MSSYLCNHFRKARNSAWKSNQVIANYLREGGTTSSEIKNSKFIEDQEKQRLETYISENQLWIERIDISQYVSEGAEQKSISKIKNQFSNYIIQYN